MKFITRTEKCTFLFFTKAVDKQETVRRFHINPPFTTLLQPLTTCHTHGRVLFPPNPHPPTPYTRHLRHFPKFRKCYLLLLISFRKLFFIPLTTIITRQKQTIRVRLEAPWWHWQTLVYTYMYIWVFVHMNFLEVDTTFCFR